MADNPSGATDDSPAPRRQLSRRFSRHEIAKNELERAISLWFEGRVADSPSVHTLTVAAQGVLDALCRDMKIPRSKLVVSVESKSERVRKMLRNPQNFFKHGHHYHAKSDKDHVAFPPVITDGFIMDNVETYTRLFGAVSAIMVCFTLRFWYENPITRSAKKTQAVLIKRLRVKNPGEVGRREFLRRVLPIVGEFARRKPHVEPP
jgi:hypothetical protein